MSHLVSPKADRVRRRAKAIKKQQGISHNEALEVAAREVGFASYHAFITTEKTSASAHSVSLARFRALVQKEQLVGVVPRGGASFDPETGFLFSMDEPKDVIAVKERRVLRRLFVQLHPDVPLSLYEDRERMKKQGRVLAEDRGLPGPERVRGVELLFKAWYARSAESLLAKGYAGLKHPGFSEYARHLWHVIKLDPVSPYWMDLGGMLDNVFLPLGPHEPCRIRIRDNYWSPAESAQKRDRPRGVAFNVIFGKNPRYRPPGAMALEDHRQCARILKRLYHLSEFRSGVKNRIDAIRSTLDDWIQREYDYDRLPNKNFHEDYYYGRHFENVRPLEELTAEDAKRFVEQLAVVEWIVRDAYVDCRPRDELLRDLHQCRGAVDRWYLTSLRKGRPHTQRDAERPRVRSRLVLPDIGAPRPVAEISALEALDHAMRLLQIYLERYGRTWRRSMRRDVLYGRLRRELPYVLHETNRADQYLLVNRDYKPVGLEKREHVDYEKYRNLHVRLSPRQLASVVLPPYSHGLFGDGTTPWRKRAHAEAYLVRLRALRELIGVAK